MKTLVVGSSVWHIIDAGSAVSRLLSRLDQPGDFARQASYFPRSPKRRKLAAQTEKTGMALKRIVLEIGMGTSIRSRNYTGRLRCGRCATRCGTTRWAGRGRAGGRCQLDAGRGDDRRAAPRSG